MGAVISQCGCMAEDIGKIFDAYWYLALPTAEVPSVWPDSYNTLYNNATPMEVKFNGTSFQSYMSVSMLTIIRPMFKSAAYSKTCLKQPLKKDKTKILITNGSLMKVKSIAECSPWSILQYF